MNFLAHAQLAGKPIDLAVGGVIGEYIKGADMESLPMLLGAGVKLHRLIDVFTDQHDFVAKYKTSVKGSHRRYAGIVLDIYCDYLLVQNWALFSSENLDEFIQNLYVGIQKEAWRVPGKYQPVLKALVDDNWLKSYHSIDGIYAAVLRIEKRLGKTLGLRDLLTGMNADSNLKIGFIPFYRDLEKYVSTQKTILLNEI